MVSGDERPHRARQAAATVRPVSAPLVASARHWPCALPLVGARRRVPALSHVATGPAAGVADPVDDAPRSAASAFDLHLAVPAHPRAPDVLVLYASGDGGWFGAAVDMFRAVGDAGFYAVGLSSRTLLHRKLARRPAAHRRRPGRGLPRHHRSRVRGAAAAAGAARRVHRMVARRQPRRAGRRRPSRAAAPGGRHRDRSGGRREPRRLERYGRRSRRRRRLARNESSLDMYALIAQVAPRPVRGHPGDRRPLSAGEPRAGAVRRRHRRCGGSTRWRRRTTASTAARRRSSRRSVRRWTGSSGRHRSRPAEVLESATWL